MKTCCMCAICRRAIRRAIVETFRRRRRWLGEYAIRYYARLGWVPLAFYREVIGEMLGLGLLIISDGPEVEFPRYLLSSLAMRCTARKAVRK